MEREDKKIRWTIGIVASIATIAALCVAMFAFNLDIVSFLTDWISGNRQEKSQQDAINLQNTAVVLQQTAVDSESQSLKVQQTIKALQETALVPDISGTRAVEQISNLVSTQVSLDSLIRLVQATLTAMPSLSSNNITSDLQRDSNNNSIGETPVPPTMTEDNTVKIPFTSNEDQNSLSNGWVTYLGKSEANNIRLSDNGNTLTIVTGSGTGIDNGKDSAPYVSYPLSGNFTIQITSSFNPQEKHQVIGFGIRSRDREGQWISIRKYSESPGNKYIDVIETQNNVTRSITRRIPYIKDNLHFRIQRQDEQITFWASENGTNWFSIKNNHVFSLPTDLFGFIYIWSSSPTGTLAHFNDFQLVDQPNIKTGIHNGEISFQDISIPGSLNRQFGWFPGGSQNNSYKLMDGKLKLICGSGTQNENGNASAPTIILPVSGNFETRVKLEFNPQERHQLAGFGISQIVDTQKWIAIRRWSDSPNGQWLGIELTQDFSSRETAKMDFNDTEVFLKVIRSEPLISFYYSKNGLEWVPIQEDVIMSFEDDLLLFLYCWSTSANGIQSTFSDLQFIQK